MSDRPIFRPHHKLGQFVPAYVT